MNDIFEALLQIVGKDHVSSQEEERYFYARDSGLMPPHEPDYVVAPKTTEEVQRIVKLANDKGIPIVPAGAGLALTGLVVPLKGGIVIDMKRMNKILEVNEKARYAIVEGGTSHGAVKAYLDKHYPTLRHSIPDAPPAVTIGSNIVIHGQGRLAQQYGFNSDMVSGLEVVTPTGDICKIGSCSMSKYWFSKGPSLPDLSGLFIGWLGSTGILTKVGLKLYPKKKIRDIEIFVTDKEDLVPDILYKLTHTEMVEDINAWFQPLPLMFKGNHHVNIYITGDTEEEIEFKKKIVWDSLKGYFDAKDGGFMWVFPAMKTPFLEMPQKSFMSFADLKKGGGFEYSGPIILVEKYPKCVQKLMEIGSKSDLAYSGFARIIGRSHCMMYSFALAFNRADSDMMNRVRKAINELAEFVYEEGGIPWKPSVEEQKMALEHMDPNTIKLMKMIKDNLDPNGIMNPGNWEVN